MYVFETNYKEELSHFDTFNKHLKSDKSIDTRNLKPVNYIQSSAMLSELFCKRFVHVNAILIEEDFLKRNDTNSRKYYFK